MRYILNFIIVLCLSVAFQPLQAQDNIDSTATYCIPVRSLSEENLPFKSGEEMSFMMHYHWGVINSDVGTANVRTDTVTYNGVKAFHTHVTGKTTKIYDLFFTVREDFQSWFAVDGLRPLRFERNTREGSYRARNTYIYDWNAQDPHIVADVYSTSSGQRYPEIPLTPCTFDLPALFYFARNMDFDKVVPGERHPMTFAIDDDVYNVYFILHGRETIHVKGLGDVKTIKFAAKLLAGGVFTGEEDMMVWITDDENRIPVYFEAPILVGVASGRLTGYSGLKYPFSSLLPESKKRK